MQLIDVYSNDCDQILYEILAERTPEESISHKKMPTYDEHLHFVRSLPYKHWYLIDNDEPVGTIYLTEDRQVGIHIISSHRRRGYARDAIDLLLDRHPGELLANVAPENYPSHELWKSIGGHIIQVTYEVPSA